MPTDCRPGKVYKHLAQLSPADKKFQSRKILTQEVCRLYGINDGFLGFIVGKRFVSFESYSVKMKVCGSWLVFVENAEGELKLVDARFCKIPNCPMCQWRRFLKWRGKFLTLLPQIQEQYPTHRWLFLTLTVRNCELQNLRLTINHLNDGFNRLSKLKQFPMEGLVKSIEVTRAWDCYDQGVYLGRHGTTWVMKWEYNNKRSLDLEPTTEVHPHLHVCGLVAASYFGKNYVTQPEWTELWKQSLRIDYQPIVNIKTVKPRKEAELLVSPEEFGEDSSTDKSGMIRAVCETLKYTVKEKDLVGAYCKDDNANSAWLKDITQQLYKARKVEYRGTLKDIGKELEEAFNSDDLIKVSDDDDSAEQANLQKRVFLWVSSIEKYVLIESNKLDVNEDE